MWLTIEYDRDEVGRNWWERGEKNGLRNIIIMVRETDHQSLPFILVVGILF